MYVVCMTTMTNTAATTTTPRSYDVDDVIARGVPVVVTWTEGDDQFTVYGHQLPEASGDAEFPVLVIDQEGDELYATAAEISTDVHGCNCGNPWTNRCHPFA